MTHSASTAHSPAPPAGKPDTFLQSRRAMFDGFLRLACWAGLHVLLVVGYLTAVFALGIDWLTTLAVLFLTGLAAGRLLGLSRAWIAAMLVQAGIVLVARAGVWMFSFIL